jgi:hypothetical protein
LLRTDFENYSVFKPVAQQEDALTSSPGRGIVAAASLACVRVVMARFADAVGSFVTSWLYSPRSRGEYVYKVFLR